MDTADQQLYFANRGEWRAWLEANHATAKEVWLVIYKKHTGQLGLSYEEAVEEALCFGWIDGLLHRIDDEKYALRYSPRKKGSSWWETNKRPDTQWKVPSSHQNCEGKGLKAHPHRNNFQVKRPPATAAFRRRQSEQSQWVKKRTSIA